jgi:hypothetical protein
MATIEWLACEQCGKVEEYAVLDDGRTSIERGHFLGHNRDIATGFKSRAEAEAWLEKRRADAGDTKGS